MLGTKRFQAIFTLWELITVSAIGCKARCAVKPVASSAGAAPYMSTRYKALSSLAHTINNNCHPQVRACAHHRLVHGLPNANTIRFIHYQCYFTLHTLPIVIM